MASRGGLRERYGRVFVTRLPDNINIPWRPLSIGEWIDYKGDLLAGNIPPHVLEEEIFRKCVVDPALAKDDKLDAGIVPVVAKQILDASGVDATEDFNADFQMARERMSSPFHEFVVLISRVFPGFSPEDIYALPYEKFLDRLAQAEAVLLKSKVLPQPLFLQNPEELEKKKVKKKKLLDQIPLKEQFQKQQQGNPPVPATPPGEKKPLPKFIVSDEEMQLAHNAAGTDPRELKRLQEQARIVYADRLPPQPEQPQQEPEPKRVPGTPKKNRRRHGRIRQ